MNADGAAAGDPARVRDAATVILVRDPDGPEPRVLMGQRGKHAAFMPNKYVFPGGAVDAVDAEVPVVAAEVEPLSARLSEAAPAGIGPAVLACAVRELWEETGQILGVKGVWPGAVPAGWTSFAATGHLPSAEAMAFVFRAKTPMGRPRRFDARFLLVDAARLAMRGVKGLDGKTIIGVTPKYLVIGPELETKAEKLLAAIYAATTDDVQPIRLKLVVEPRITGTGWYVMADPAAVPSLQFAYLSSAQGVQIQRQEAWTTLGMQYRAFLDFGTGWADWRGAYFNEGA